MWTYLTEDDVRTRLTAPEIAALSTVARATGQPDRLPELIMQIVREVRGYVAANSANQLGGEQTIPDELRGAAVSRLRFELATVIPADALLTESRKESNHQAINLLQQVARGDFRIEQPADVSLELTAGGAAAEQASGRCGTLGRDSLEGL